MRPPVFLSVANILYLHADTILTEGGGDGIRDLALLESATLMPQQKFADRYLHPDLPSMAAAYLYCLCTNHPFVDGNKRVGAIAAYAFLDLNGYALDASETEFEETVMRLAAGELSKAELTRWFHTHAASSHDGV